MRTLIDDMLGLVSTAAELEPRLETRRHAKTYVPTVMREDTGEAYEVTLVAPGLPKDEISVEVKGRTLRVAHQGTEKSRIPYAPFERAWVLPNDADLDTIEAKHEHGILVITVPKLASITKTRSISIL